MFSIFSALIRTILIDIVHVFITFFSSYEIKYYACLVFVSHLTSLDCRLLSSREKKSKQNKVRLS